MSISNFRWAPWSDTIRLFVLRLVVFLSFLQSPVLGSDGLMFDNCGVNSALVVLSRFNRQTDKPQLIRILNVGEDFSAPTNFRAFKKLFSEYGLVCYAFKNVSLAEIEMYTNESCLAIMQITKIKDHFIVVHKRKDKMMVFDDFPQIDTVLAPNIFASGFSKAFKGNVIFISEKPQPALEAVLLGGSNLSEPVFQPPQKPRLQARATPDAEASKIHEKVFMKGEFIAISGIIELGAVSSRQESVSSQFEVINNSEEHIRINKIKGACSCFSGAEPNGGMIAPHSSLKFTVRFNPQNLPTADDGEISTAVVLETSDPKLKVAKLLVRGKISNTFEWALIPSKIDMGSIASPMVTTQIAKIALVGAEDNLGDSFEIVEGSLSDISARLVIYPKATPSGPYFKYGYIDVAFRAPPKGRFFSGLKVRNIRSGEIQVAEIKGVVLSK